MTQSQIKEVQLSKLRKELDKLKKKASLGFELEVEWLPDLVKYSKEGKVLRGEVSHTKIFVYDENFVNARETLRHEFIEYLIDQTAIPYRDLVNILLDHLQYQAYSVKDRIAKGLADLFA